MTEASFSIIFFWNGWIWTTGLPLFPFIFPKPLDYTYLVKKMRLVLIFRRRQVGDVTWFHYWHNGATSIQFGGRRVSRHGDCVSGGQIGSSRPLRDNPCPDCLRDMSPVTRHWFPFWLQHSPARQSNRL